jgi:hypothetical protein
MPKEAKLMFLSFIYFSLVMEQNEEIPKKLKQLFYKLSKITRLYEHKLEDVLSEVNEKIKDYKKVEIDYLLASVSIVAFYFEAFKGRKRLFTPFSHKEILELQDELLELSDTNANDTFDFCEYVVYEILKD